MRFDQEMFGAVVRVRRRRSMITQTAFAHRVGIDQAKLSRVEGGKISDVETFLKLCKWLNIDPFCEIYWHEKD